MSTADASKFNALTTGDEVVAAWPERVAHRIFLVTGASPTSIGFTTLTSLAKARPAALILVGRSAAKISSTAAALRAIDADIYILEVIADLSSSSSVQAGAEKIINDSRITHVDVMVNNAGIMAGPHEKSVDGIELQFATNHIGHFLLTALLAPKLRASPEGGRIVNVTSAGHRKVNFTRVEDYDPLFERHEYEQWDAYGNSKLANILLTKGLVSRGFEAYSVHPGSTPTTNLGERIKNDIGPAVTIFAAVPDMEPFEPMKSLEQGPNAQLVAALRPAGELPKGAYLWQCQVATPSEYARDEGGVLTKRLWEVSERVVRRKFE